MKSRIQNLNIPFLNFKHKEMLNKPFTPEEVKIAAFQIRPFKAPGIDGKPGMFYQKYWNIIGNLTTASTLSCLNSGCILKELNKTLITLIPKMDCPRNVSQYRPISLCNVAYKIIVKIIVNRLQPIMGDLISPYQTAFIKGRSISNNIIVSSEVMSTIGKRKSRRGFLEALKLDMDKAYDRISWNFIKVVMDCMGFNCHWIKSFVFC